MSNLETHANTYKEIKNMKSCAFTGHRPQIFPLAFVKMMNAALRSKKS